MRKYLVLAPCFYGFFGVSFAAYAAHGLRSSISAQRYEGIQTGLDYLFIHALVLLFLGMYWKGSQGRFFASSLLCFNLGIHLFCGSLFGLGIAQRFQLNGTWLTHLTPSGGMLLMAGWFLLGCALFQAAKNAE